MPEERVELSWGCPRRILSPVRLPFRHSGSPALNLPLRMVSRHPRRIEKTRIGRTALADRPTARPAHTACRCHRRLRRRRSAGPLSEPAHPGPPQHVAARPPPLANPADLVLEALPHELIARMLHRVQVAGDLPVFVPLALPQRLAVALALIHG